MAMGALWSRQLNIDEPEDFRQTNEEENEPEDFRQTNEAENDDKNQEKEQDETESKDIETSKELPKSSSGRKIKAPKKLDL